MPKVRWRLSQYRERMDAARRRLDRAYPRLSSALDLRAAYRWTSPAPRSGSRRRDLESQQRIADFSLLNPFGLAEDDLAVLRLHVARTAHVRALFRHEAVEHDLVARLDGILVESGTRHRVGRSELALPLFHRARLVFYIEVDPGMRISPVELGERA